MHGEKLEDNLQNKHKILQYQIKVYLSHVLGGKEKPHQDISF